MRIALIPLDSRPANYQFPQRLADIGGIELALPPRGLLGGLHHAADSAGLLDWLRGAVSGCDALVLSLDALLYGGLIQSRAPGALLTPLQLSHALYELGLGRLPLYAYLSVPRLGTSVITERDLEEHEALRAALREGGDWAADKSLHPALALRARNQANALDLLALADEHNFALLHFAVEDNAPSGPHIAEVEELRHSARELNHERRGAGKAAIAVSFFDGADECACLLLARACADLQRAEAVPLKLAVHPSMPGPERYTGLFETHTLQEGLDFLAQFLRFDYNAQEPVPVWLVCYGTQPQPDVFAGDPARIFNNPFLIPERPEPRIAGQPLFVSDIAACNGGNPHLAQGLATPGVNNLAGYLAWNTNFNTLGSSAALISMAWRASIGIGEGVRDMLKNPHNPLAGLRRFMLERLADDLVYQTLARPEVLAWCKQQHVNPFDFGGLAEHNLQQLRMIVRRHWREWSEGAGAALLRSLRISAQAAALTQFDFPWQRAFEVEASAPEL